MSRGSGDAGRRTRGRAESANHPDGQLTAQREWAVLSGGRAARRFTEYLTTNCQLFNIRSDADWEHVHRGLVLPMRCRTIAPLEVRFETRRWP